MKIRIREAFTTRDTTVEVSEDMFLTEVAAMACRAMGLRYPSPVLVRKDEMLQRGAKAGSVLRDGDFLELLDLGGGG